MKTKVIIQPSFIPGTQGQLFSLERQPPQDIHIDCQHCVILIPPFCEEMNKSRRMYTLLGEALAMQGITSIQLDLFGTGDSEGDFGDATWEIWRQDLIKLIDMTHARGIEKISLLGLRSAALLALDCSKNVNTPLYNIIFWQPILSGEIMMSQFFRLRLAAAMFRNTEKKETSKDFINALLAGESVEIAGYELSSSLYKTISSLSLVGFADTNTPAIHWFEVLTNADRPLPVPSRRTIDAWLAKNISVNVEPVVGETFWSLQEINTIPSLIEKTVNVLSH